MENDKKKIQVMEVPTEYKLVIAEIDEKNPENMREVSEKVLLTEIYNDIKEIKKILGIVKN